MKRFYTAIYCLLFIGFLTSISFFSYGQNAIVQSVAGSIPVDKIQVYKNRALASYKKVVDNDLFQDILNGKQVELPFGIKKEGSPYTIIIDSIYLEARTAKVVAFCIYEDPQSPGKPFIFAGRGIEFTRKGGFSGTARIDLIESPPIKLGPVADPYLTIDFVSGYQTSKQPYTDAKSFSAQTANTDANRNTYIEFDCKGFKKLYLNADLTFSKKYIVKEINGKADYNSTVSLPFKAEVDREMGWLIDLHDVPMFQFTKLPDYSFSIGEAAFDKSSGSNPEKLRFPNGYVGGEALGMTWTGFFASNINVYLPKMFKKKGGAQASGTSAGKDDRIKITFDKLLIDDSGLSLEAHGRDIITIDKSDTKWPMSVDYFNLSIIKNDLHLLEFNGDIILSVQRTPTKENGIQALGYEGKVSFNESTKKLDYHLQAILKDSLSIECFKVAEITLHPNSSMEVNYVAETFEFKAILNGAFILSPNLQAGSTTIAKVGLGFEELMISSTPGYLDAKTLTPISDIDFKSRKSSNEGKGGDGQAASGAGSMGGLSVTLKDISLVSGENGARGISMTIAAELNGSSSGADFGAEGSFTIWADHELPADKWKFRGVELNKLVLSVDNGFYSLKGMIEHRTGDLYWGSFYGGGIELTLMQKKIVVKVEGRFGQIRSNKYWGVDGFAGGFKIPLTPAVAINAFTGGISKNLGFWRQGTDNPGARWQNGVSGLSYKVDTTIALTVNAGIGLVSGASENLFAGNIRFIVQFTKTEGLGMIRFTGGIGLLGQKTGGDQEENAAKAVDANSEAPAQQTSDVADQLGNLKKPEIFGIEAKVTLGWDMAMDFTNNSFWGQFGVWINVGVVEGAYDQGLAGIMSIAFTPNMWYVYIGEPLTPVSIYADLKIIRPKISTYFVMGSKLPTPPIAPIPSEVTDTPLINYDALGIGGGIAFGTRIEIESRNEVKFGRSCYVAAYLNMMMMAGFDVLLMRSNQDVYCKGQSEPRGIKNWYATGQLYMLGKVDIGGSVGCFGMDFNVNLLSIKLYLAMAAQLPNPNYFRGKAGFDITVCRVDLLLTSFDVKVDGEADVEFGEQCQVTDGTANERSLSIISQISPGNVEKASVYTRPQVYFSYKIGEALKFSAEQESGRNSAAPIKIRPVMSASDAITVTVDGKVVPFTKQMAFDGMTMTVTPSGAFADNAKVIVTAKVTFEKFDGQQWAAYGDIVPDVQTITFTVAEEVQTIDPINVKFAYPHPGMTNFYVDEYPNGYLTTVSRPGKAYDLMGGNYTYIVKITGPNGFSYTTEKVVFNEGTARHFSYPLPANLQVSTKYNVEFVKKSVNTDFKDIAVLKYDFTTSKYRNFSTKVSSMGRSAATVNESNWSVTSNLLTDASSESFSAIEIDGVNSGGVVVEPGLLGMESVHWSDAYEKLFKDKYNTINASYYDFKTGVSRDAIPYQAIKVSGSSFTYDVWKTFRDEVNMAKNNIFFEYEKARAVDDKGRMDAISSQIQTIENSYPGIVQGNYTVIFKYRLPGDTQPHSTVNFLVKVPKDVVYKK